VTGPSFTAWPVWCISTEGERAYHSPAHAHWGAWPEKKTCQRGVLPSSLWTWQFL